MRTYTITRNGEKIGAVYGDSKRGAAMEWATRMAKRLAIIEELPDGTYQALAVRPKLRTFEPVGQPYAVEGGR